jgi:hypothetical protein
MMTQTILSVTTPARPERRAALRGSGFVPPGKSLDAGSVAQALLPVRYCYAECEEPLHTVASHAAKNPNRKSGIRISTNSQKTQPSKNS